MSHATISLRPPSQSGVVAEHLGHDGAFETWRIRVRRLIDQFIRDDWRGDPELTRRARLIVRFGLLGFGSGTLYAVFYFIIGHLWGAAITAVCSAAFGIAPWLMRKTRRLRLAGNWLTAIMTLGFTALSCVEGGLQGHAVAWLASVPLCALLLVGKESARLWVFICFVAAGAIVAADIGGINFPMTYDPAWHSLLTSAGYLGLIVFMFLLGLIFENGRSRAFAKMEDALAELASSNGKLTVLNNEKTEFLGIAAHDLRNPLTTIVAYAQILEMGVRPDEIPKMCGAIRSAGTRMRDLITNLLDSNAIEEGRFTCKIEPCDLNALVAQSLEHNGLNATRKKIAFLVDAAPDLWASTDQSATVQILDNLVSNAIKYSPFETTVCLKTEARGDQAWISVKDEGPGISDDDQKRLFGKFSRLSAQPTGGESSNGLGLSIVKKLAATMSGSVECHSIFGDGATFIVRLPIAGGIAPVSRRPATSPLAVAGILLLLAFSAQAAGLLDDGADARSIGLGGADAAQTGGVIAAFNSNPAALAAIQRPQFEIGSGEGFLRGEFRRDDSEPAHLRKNSLLLPAFGLAVPAPMHLPATFGIGFIPQTTAEADWRFRDADGGLGGLTSYGEQRHRSTILGLRTSVGLAVQPVRWLSLGASAGFLYNANSLQAPYIFQNQQVLAGFKTLLDLETDGVAPTFDLGLQIRPSSKFTFGASYRPSVVVHSDGTASGNASAQLQALGGGFAAVDPHFAYDAEVRTKFPRTVVLGAEWQALDRLRLVSGIDWINWSDAFDQLRIDLSRGNNSAINTVVGSNALTDIAPLRWRDQFVYRAGLEYFVGAGFTARVGYNYARSPVPSETLTPLTAAIFEHKVSLGFGYQKGPYHTDVAWQWSLPAKQTVGRSVLLDGEYSHSSVQVTAQVLQVTTGVEF